MPAPLGDGPGAVADAFPPLQGLRDERVVLEALELVEGAEPGILVVEIDDKADRHLVVRQMIEIKAPLTLAASLLPERPAAAVQHAAGMRLAGGHLPQLLEADGIVLGLVLGLGGVFQMELGDQLLAEVAAGPLGEQGVAAIERHAGYVIRPGVAVSVQPEIAGDHPSDPPLLHDEFAGHEAGVDLDPERFCLPAEPAAEVAEADDVAAVVVHARRYRPAGQLQGAALVSQQMDLVICDRHAEGGLLPAFRQQLLEGNGIEQGAREQMSPDFRPFLQQADREIRGLLLQCDGGTEASRAATDDDDIKFHCFAFHLASALDLA
ncbi:hypothetical protein D3C87_1213370 [compost metagenome]